MTDFKAMTKTNAANLKRLDNGGSIEYMYTMGGRDVYLLIGKGHDPKTVQDVTKAKHFSGKMEIKKGGLTNAGTLFVSGCSANRSQLETYLKTFTNKKIQYV